MKFKDLKMGAVFKFAEFDSGLVFERTSARGYQVWNPNDKDMLAHGNTFKVGSTGVSVKVCLMESIQNEES